MQEWSNEALQPQNKLLKCSFIVDVYRLLFLLSDFAALHTECMVPY